MTAGRRLTEAEKQEILRRMQAGRSIEEVCDMFNITRKTVRSVVSALRDRKN